MLLSIEKTALEKQSFTCHKCDNPLTFRLRLFDAYGFCGQRRNKSAFPYSELA
jgi:hypothetical protein